MVCGGCTRRGGLTSRAACFRLMCRRWPGHRRPVCVLRTTRSTVRPLGLAEIQEYSYLGLGRGLDSMVLIVAVERIDFAWTVAVWVAVGKVVRVAFGEKCVAEELINENTASSAGFQPSSIQETLIHR